MNDEIHEIEFGLGLFELNSAAGRLKEYEAA